MAREVEETKCPGLSVDFDTQILSTPSGGAKLDRRARGWLRALCDALDDMEGYDVRR